MLRYYRRGSQDAGGRFPLCFGVFRDMASLSAAISRVRKAALQETRYVP